MSPTSPLPHNDPEPRARPLRAFIGQIGNLAIVRKDWERAEQFRISKEDFRLLSVR